MIEDLQKKLDSYPGVIFNFTQPAEDAVDEALTGLKSSLAVKIFGPDLQVLEKKAVEIKNVLSKTPGFTDLTVVRELGQPSLLIDADRAKIARYGINVADVEAVVQAAVGGQAATQVIQGEKLFDLVVRMDPKYRSDAREIGNLLVPAPGGQQIPLSELATIKEANGASFIYRENNSRYIGIQFSIEGRNLEGIVKAGQKNIAKNVSLPEGYRLDWGGEYSELLEAKSQLYVIGPLAIFLIFMILFALYGNFKFPVTIALGVVLTEPVGALIALKLTHTPLSVSSALGLLALLGCLGGNRGHSCELHQQVTPGGQKHSRSYAGSFAPAAAADHDDGAGGLSGSSSGCHVHGSGQRHAKALRHRRRRRIALAIVSGLLREPGPV